MMFSSMISVSLEKNQDKLKMTKSKAEPGQRTNQRAMLLFFYYQILSMENITIN